MTRINVVQKPSAEFSVEILAQAIADIGAAVRRLNESRLTRGALVVLLNSLETRWLKPVKKK